EWCHMTVVHRHLAPGQHALPCPQQVIGDLEPPGRRRIPETRDNVLRHLCRYVLDRCSSRRLHGLGPDCGDDDVKVILGSEHTLAQELQVQVQRQLVQTWLPCRYDARVCALLQEQGRVESRSLPC